MFEIVYRDVSSIAVQLDELCPARLRLVQLVQELSRERSVGAHSRACPTHRRHFWLSSANNGGTSVSRRTRSCVTCSSGILATICCRRRKCTPLRCTASVFEIGHTSELKHITDRTSAQYRHPFTSVAMDDEHHRVLRESNTAHAMPQRHLTSTLWYNRALQHHQSYTHRHRRDQLAELPTSICSVADNEARTAVPALAEC